MNVHREQQCGHRIPSGHRAPFGSDVNVPTYVKGHALMNNPIEPNNQLGSSPVNPISNQSHSLSSTSPARTAENRLVGVQPPMRASNQPRRHQHPGTVAGRVQTWCAKQVLQAFYMGNNVTII